MRNNTVTVRGTRSAEACFALPLDTQAPPAEFVPASGEQKAILSP